jgi:hypothetical protein
MPKAGEEQGQERRDEWRPATQQCLVARLHRG